VSRPPSELQDDTVDALVDTVRELLTSEDGRTQSLLGRGSGLAGFAGLIVSLSGLIAREVVAHDQAACYAYTASGFLARSDRVARRHCRRPRDSVAALVRRDRDEGGEQPEPAREPFDDGLPDESTNVDVSPFSEPMMEQLDEGAYDVS
jgi:hypothetical protein